MYNMFGSEGFTVKKYIEVLEGRLCKKIDIVVANNFIKNSSAQYEQILVDVENGWKSKKIVITNFEKKSENLPRWNELDNLAGVLEEVFENF